MSRRRTGANGTWRSSPIPSRSRWWNRNPPTPKRNAEIEAQAIRVNVLDGGKIMLEGKVHAWSERRAAERAAWSAPGVNTVDDRLTIG